MQSCLSPALLTLPRLGIFPSTSYHVLQTLLRKRVCRTYNYILLCTTSYSSPNYNEICCSPRSCIFTLPLIHILPACKSTFDLYHSHGSMLNSKPFSRTLFFWSIQVRALRISCERSPNARLRTPSSTTPVTGPVCVSEKTADVHEMDYTTVIERDVQKARANECQTFNFRNSYRHTRMKPEN